MNASILTRTKLWTLLAAVVITMVLRFRYDQGFAFSFLGAAVWAVLSFWVVEGLVRAALVPPGRPRPTGRLVRLVAAKAGLYGLALWVLLTGYASPIGCIFGFMLLMIVLVIVALVGKSTPGSGPPAE